MPSYAVVSPTSECPRCPGPTMHSVPGAPGEKLLRSDGSVFYEHLFYEHSGELLQSGNVLTQPSLSSFFLSLLLFPQAKNLKDYNVAFGIYIASIRKGKNPQQFINFGRHCWGYFGDDVHLCLGTGTVEGFAAVRTDAPESQSELYRWALLHSCADNSPALPIDSSGVSALTVYVSIILSASQIASYISRIVLALNLTTCTKAI